MTIDKMPASPDVERTVIGAMMFDNSCVSRVLDYGEFIFYRPENRCILEAVRDLDTDSVPVDQLTVTERLRARGELDTAGGECRISAISAETATSANIDNYLTILARKAALRKLLNVSQWTQAQCTGHDADPLAVMNSITGHLLGIRDTLGEKDKSLAEQVREWVLASEGHFLASEVFKELNVASKGLKRNCNQILRRLVSEGVIERYGNKRGSYRRIEDDCEQIDFLGAGEETIDVRYPLGIENFVETMPGNIVVVAGEQNAGKTAFLLNFIRMNMAMHDIWYFNSEMGSSELRKRLCKFEDLSIGDWRFNARERSGNFHDVIRPDSVNIIDFLEIHEDFYKVGGMMKRIHDKLENGIAVIAVQKTKGSELGRGGSMSMEKPRIYLSLAQNECTIVKGKNWARENINPNGRKFSFKLVQGARFISTN